MFLAENKIARNKYKVKPMAVYINGVNISLAIDGALNFIIEGP